MSFPYSFPSPEIGRIRSIRRDPVITMVSTYPPKLCGLATFAAALEDQLIATGAVVKMVRIDDGDEVTTPGPTQLMATRRRPIATLVNGDRVSIRNAAFALSQGDVAIVQHEYGIYGGPDGDEVIALLTGITIPVIVTLHTVPLHPNDRQRALLSQISGLCDRLVVMTNAAHARLIAGYDVDPSKVIVIPHGAWTAGASSELPTRLPAIAPTLLTWGLIGPGKGIEHVIGAMRLLRDLESGPRYVVAGVTHPKVIAQQGDSYRQSLIAFAQSTGVDTSVHFDATYRDRVTLGAFVAAATVVVLPYDSRDQVTSGVLVDAIAAGRPVVATAFPHAVELLGSGAGIIVPHEDPRAIASAIRSILTDQAVYLAMQAEAAEVAQSFSWSTVAKAYASVSDQLMALPKPVAV